MPDGSTKQFCRDARTLDDARANLKELKGDFKGVKRGDDTERIQNKIKGRRMRFRELARIFEEKKLQPLVYDDPDSDNRQKQKGIVRFEDSNLSEHSGLKVWWNDDPRDYTRRLGKVQIRPTERAKTARRWSAQDLIRSQRIGNNAIRVGLVNNSVIGASEAVN